MSAARPAPPAPVSAPAPLARLPSLSIALVLLAALAVATAARLPGFPVEFAGAFAMAALLRLAIGRGGQRLAPAAVLQSLGAVLAVVGMLWLFPRRGTAILVGGLAVLTAMQSLFILALWARRGVYTVVLASSVTVVATGLLRKDPGTLALSVAYTVALLFTLVLLERRDALAEAATTTRGVRKVHFLGREVLPLGTALRAVGALVLIGFPIGLGLFVVVPRIGLDARPSRDLEAAARDGEGGPFEGRRASTGATGYTGMPKDTGIVEFGSVAEIKESHLPVLQVGRPDGRRPEGVYLRDNIMDVYDAERAQMRASPALRADVRRLDPNANGWFQLEPSPRVLATWRRDPERLWVRILRGGFGRWFLMPWPLRARLVRDGRAVTRCGIRVNGYHTLALRMPGDDVFREQDVIELVYVPQRRQDAELTGHRSDPAVSPLPTYVALPPRTRRALAPLARSVVGEEADPWRRARRLEAWLRAPPFEYTLSIPALDADERIVDFLTDVRRGHCELYAIGLLALLRSLDHPARYARGFWGGDPLGAPDSDEGTVVMRNGHYHAWVELYLDDVGWVALNPTPPDRRPVDAELVHGEDPDAGGGREDGAAPDAALLEFGRDEYDAFWHDVGRRARDAVTGLARFLFSARSGHLGVVLLVLVLLSSVVLRRRHALRRAAGGGPYGLPRGPYGRALVLLAKKGVRRPPSQTPRELAAGVARLHPDAGAPMARLTALFERERYGGEPGAASGREARRAFDALAAALRANRSTHVSAAPSR